MRPSNDWRRVAAFLAALFSAPLLVAPAAAQRTGTPGSPRFQGKLEPCDLPAFPERALCGRYEVFENRAAASDRRLSLQVVVLPATGTPTTDALTFLTGGGVLPATRMAPFFDRALTGLNQERDILLVDQRGTGRSGALECEAPDWQAVLAGDRSREDYMKALRECRDVLGRYVDLSLYTTPNAADDLDEIRTWLGYETLSVWGASYGTKVGRVYARRHPTRVRAMALHGTVPLAFSMWPDLGPSGVRALTALLDRCEADDACKKAYPESLEALEAVLARLAGEPVDADRPKGELGPRRVNGRVAAAIIVGALGQMRMARGIPLWIHAASQGDDSYLVALSASGGPSEVPLGVYYSIACSEEYARPGGVPAAPAFDVPPGLDVFLEVSDLERDREVCGFWPRASLPEAFWAPVQSPVPTLFVTGADDFITPPEYARRVAEGFPNATALVLRDRSHNDLDPCVAGIVERFLMDPGAESLDTTCVDETPAFRFERPDRASRP
jgi:pimeloyl-ACP methyl ester carboxylesterase